MNKKVINIIALLINLTIIVLEIIGAILSVGKNGWSSFQFYTEDSNYLLTISATIFSVYLIINLLSKKSIPSWVYFLKYIAVCCVTLTFLVVLFVLGPMAESSAPGVGYVAMLFNNSMLYHHFLCPLLALLSFFLCEREYRMDKKALFIGSAPTLLYATIIIILNLTRAIVGPYPFLRVYEQPWYMSIMWVIIIIGGAFLIQWLLWFIHNKTLIKEKK